MFQLHCIDETAIAVAKRCPPHLLLPSRLQQEVYRDPSRALQLHKIIVLTSMHIYVLEINILLNTTSLWSFFSSKDLI